MVSLGPVAATTAYLSLSAKARKILGHKLMTKSLPVDRAPKHLASKDPLIHWQGLCHEFVAQNFP